MRIAALAVWCTTAAAGIYLLTTWLSQGGLRQQATRITTFPTVLVFAHPLLAVAGLCCWIGYLESSGASLAWTSFWCLCASALLGFVMFTRWLAGRGGRHARGAGQRFPVTAVAVHGTVGLTTFILVLIVANLASHH